MCCVALVLAGCGEQEQEQAQTFRAADTGPIHVHGLGVDPADGSLFIATHTGLFRAAGGERRARRVAGRYQDTMGFAVTGPNRFLGSGHPDLREKLPPFLGLISSDDAGKSWRAISLQGDVDFHVLEASGRRIYGFGSDWESREPRFLTSADGGRRWQTLEAPEPLLALAISPAAPQLLIASGDRGVFRSADAGRSWSRTEAPAPGLLAWNADGIFLAGKDGRVWRSDADMTSWSSVGSVAGEPSAFDSGGAHELLAALHDGTIKQSDDGGRSWTIRSAPG